MVFKSQFKSVSDLDFNVSMLWINSWYQSQNQNCFLELKSDKWPSAINVSQHPVGFIRIINCTAQILRRLTKPEDQNFRFLKGWVWFEYPQHDGLSIYVCRRSQIFDEEMLTFKSLLDYWQRQCRLWGWMLYVRSSGKPVIMWSINFNILKILETRILIMESQKSELCLWNDNVNGSLALWWTK